MLGNGCEKASNSRAVASRVGHLILLSESDGSDYKLIAQTARDADR